MKQLISGVLGLGLINLGLTACSDAVGAPGQTLDKSFGSQLVWSDEFDGESLDRTKWTPETSCWGGGNNERQCYVDSPETIRIEDGALILGALEKTARGLEFPQDRTERGEIVSRDYVSGKVRTLGHAAWTYGRFEARIKLSKGQSLWPAFWMLPVGDVYGGWPQSGEIDIMEAINLGAICETCTDATENRSSGALHFGDSWPENRFLAKKTALLGAPVDGWHVYALDWRADKMEWFVDGKVFFSVSSDDWFTPATDKSENKTAPFDQAFYLMFNLAVGGNLPDTKNEKAFNPASFPADMKIDWVRVYE